MILLLKEKNLKIGNGIRVLKNIQRLLVELNLIVKMIITPIILNLMKITEILLVIKMEIF